MPRGGEREVLGPKIRNINRSFVDSPHKLYTGNLGWGLTSQALRDAFADQPGVLSAKVIYERDTGRSRGYGFVSFETAEAAQSAFDAMNGVVSRTGQLNYLSCFCIILFHFDIIVKLFSGVWRTGGRRAAVEIKYGHQKNSAGFSSGSRSCNRSCG